MEKYVTLEDNKKYEIAFICNNYLYLIDHETNAILVRKYSVVDDRLVVEPLDDEKEFEKSLELLWNDLKNNNIQFDKETK